MNVFALSGLVFLTTFLGGTYFFERKAMKERQEKILKSLHLYREQVASSVIREEIKLRKYFMIFFGMIVLFCLQSLVGFFNAVVIVAVFSFYFIYKKAREKARFDAEVLLFLPQALDALGRSLKSGLSLFQALEIVRHQKYGVISKELGFILDSMKLGIVFREALQKSAERVNVKTYQFLTLSLLIQQETGGSLVDLLYSLRDALRQKQFLNQKIHALSAQSRTSAFVLAVLPFLSFAAVYFMSPDYMMAFIDDSRGRMMGFVALGLLATGLLIIKRMMRQSD